MPVAQQQYGDGKAGRDDERIDAHVEQSLDDSVIAGGLLDLRWTRHK